MTAHAFRSVIDLLRVTVSRTVLVLLLYLNGIRRILLLTAVEFTQGKNFVLDVFHLISSHFLFPTSNPNSSDIRAWEAHRRSITPSSFS